jgi:hypothetical protein
MLRLQDSVSFEEIGKDSSRSWGCLKAVPTSACKGPSYQEAELRVMLGRSMKAFFKSSQKNLCKVSVCGLMVKKRLVLPQAG